MPPDPASYQRALTAEPALRAVDALVDTLCTLRRPTDRLCYGCVWEAIVKPLISQYVGWSRGYPPDQAKDPDQPIEIKTLSGADLLDDHERGRSPATTDTERWLRTSEAYDAVTDVLLARLKAADPGNGHGIGRREGTSHV